MCVTVYDVIVMMISWSQEKEKERERERESVREATRKKEHWKRARERDREEMAFLEGTEATGMRRGGRHRSKGKREREVPFKQRSPLYRR